MPGFSCFLENFRFFDFFGGLLESLSRKRGEGEGEGEEEKGEELALGEPQMLAGRVVLVTGGGRGLGFSIVQSALSAGARVVSADLAFPPPAQAVQQAHPASLVHLVSDVTKAEDRERMVDAAMTRFGALDGLVNNAAVDFCRPFLSTTEGEWDRVLDVSLKATFFLSQAAVRRVRGAGTSRPLSIVNISSVHGLLAMPGAGPYDSAKAGIINLTKCLAVELAEGTPTVRINAVSPGLCDTDMVRKGVFAATPDKKQAWDYWARNIPQQRMIEPSEVAAPVLFLLSDGASAMTGANLVVDGGMTSMLLSTPPYQSKPY